MECDKAVTPSMARFAASWRLLSDQLAGQHLEFIKLTQNFSTLTTFNLGDDFEENDDFPGCRCHGCGSVGGVWWQ